MEDELLKEKLEGSAEEELKDLKSDKTEGEPAPEADPTVTSAEGNDTVDTVDAADETVADKIVTEETPAEETPAEPPIVEENGTMETSIKTFTQPEVDKLVGDTRVKTREKTFNYIYNRYGVKNEEEMDALVANAQRYDTLKETTDSERAAWETEKTERDGRLTSMSEEIALMKSGVDANRYEDVKLILKGKGMEVNEENIASELATHPEWVSKEPEETVGEESNEKPVEKPAEKPAPVVTTRIKALGNEAKPAPQMSEEQEAERLFRMKFH